MNEFDQYDQPEWCAEEQRRRERHAAAYAAARAYEASATQARSADKQRTVEENEKTKEQLANLQADLAKVNAINQDDMTPNQRRRLRQTQTNYALVAMAMEQQVKADADRAADLDALKRPRTSE